jgi:hypothetical protein
MASIDTARAHQLWYVRRGGSEVGPFPARAVYEDLLVGRLSPAAEVSLDRVGWATVAKAPGLIPGTSADRAAPDAWTRERTNAARRWADARSGADRRRAERGTAHPPRRTGVERRATLGSRPRSPARRRTPAAVLDRRAALGVWVAGGLLAVLLALAGVAYGPVQPLAVDLGIPARTAQ